MGFIFYTISGVVPNRNKRDGPKASSTWDAHQMLPELTATSLLQGTAGWAACGAAQAACVVLPTCKGSGNISISSALLSVKGNSKNEDMRWPDLLLGYIFLKEKQGRVLKNGYLMLCS